jgi:hypothetical protein
MQLWGPIWECIPSLFTIARLWIASESTSELNGQKFHIKTIIEDRGHHETMRTGVTEV